MDEKAKEDERPLPLTCAETYERDVAGQKATLRLLTHPQLEEARAVGRRKAREASDAAGGPTGSAEAVQAALKVLDPAVVRELVTGSAGSLLDAGVLVDHGVLAWGPATFGADAKQRPTEVLPAAVVAALAKQIREDNTRPPGVPRS